jgi:hypothetical protein
MKRIKQFSIIVIAFIALLSGCAKDDFQEVVGLCPLVISTSPINGATSVSEKKVITATFNEEMNPSTFTNASFTVVGATPVSGTISYSGTTVTFKPNADLAANTTFICKLTTAIKDLRGNALQADFIWTFSTGLTLLPVVTTTDPLNNATAVVLNKIITASFNMPMDPLTINATTFTLKQGTTTISGTISYTGTTATFSPTTLLLPSTLYTATITNSVKNTLGTAIASNYVWSFTTGTFIAPTVIATDPTNNATAVVLNKTITATFSTAMNPLTITTTSFTLKEGTNSIAGSVSYLGLTATFNPTAALLPNKIYTATITTAAQNVAGIGLASNYVWTFSTILVPIGPVLGSASIFGAFGGNAGITNQGLNTVINNGSIATTAAATLVTGFHDSNAVYTETPLNVGNVTGSIYTAPPAPGTASSFAIASQGLLDANAAYLSISPASMPGGIDPGAGELGGLTLAPGIYKSASGTFKISNGNLTLDAQGNPNAVWVFQTAAGLTVGVAGPTGAKSVILTNGAQSKNVFWYVGSAATINGAGGGVMVGTIIANSGVTLSTAGNATQTVLNGRAISLIASVTMVNTTINVPN